MATKKLDPEMTCRGRWSVCGGKNPSRSAAWHICQECTDKRIVAMKAAVDPTPVKEAKTKAPSARKRGPRPSREPVARVPETMAALVTPTEEKKADTATGSKAIRKVLEAQRRAAVRYAPLASDRR